MDRTRIAALAPLIGGLYLEKDIHAVRIMESIASELADLATTLYRRLSFSEVIPVSYMGGIFNLGAMLLDSLAVILDARHMQLRAPKYGADVGALILAFNQAGHRIPDRFVFPEKQN